MVKSHNFVRCFSVLLLISMYIITSGCAISGSGASFAFEEADTNKAVIYHYRRSSFREHGRQWYVLSNGKPLTTIGNGGYFKQIIEPGQIIYRTKDDYNSWVGWIIIPFGNLIFNALAEYQDAYTLDVEAGNYYFLKWGFSKSNSIPRINQIPYEKAIKQIDGLLAFPPTKVMK